MNREQRRAAARQLIERPRDTVDGVPLLGPEDRERVVEQLERLRGHKQAIPLANAIIRREVFGDAPVDGDQIAKAWRVNFRGIGGAR